MCEKITYIRFILFTLIFIMLITSISYGFIFCRRKKIDMNTFSGIFEMYRHVFSFKDKIFSITILVCIYGGALLFFLLQEFHYGLRGTDVYFRPNIVERMYA